MSTYDAFAESDEGQNTQPNDKPIWALNLEGDPDPIHKWLLSEVNFLKTENADRLRAVERNLAIYKGLQYQSQETPHSKDRPERQDFRQTVQKVVANHVYDLVQNAVARQVKYRPAVQILPKDDEMGDRIGSEMTSAWLSHLWYIHKFESDMDPAMKKLARVMGEAYLYIEWDPEMGDLQPEYEDKYHAKVMKGEKVQLLDDNGNPEVDDEGKPIYIESPIRNGDVAYRMIMTTDVLADRSQQRWDLAKYVFRKETMPVELARLRWPKAADKIRGGGDTQVYDYEKLQVRRTNRNEVTVWTFHHRRCREMEKGAMIVFTADGILHKGPMPYSHRELPCIRLTDKDLPGELNGHAGIEFVKTLTGAYNNLTNMILRNQVLCAHPKWMMPAGAAKIDALGNDATVVQFKGPIAPVLVQSSPTPAEVFGFRKELKEEFQQIYGIHGISRGEPPPGIKSGVALQFMSEQEAERQNEDVLKSNEFQRQVAIMSIAVAGDYYDKDDQRQVRMLGKDNAWKTIFFDVAHLSKDYDVRVQNSSALPHSKAARTQTLIDLKSQFPDLISNEQFLDMLDFAQDQKFIDVATVAVRAAEAENEALLNPEEKIETSEPQDYENHILHWKVHVKPLQEWSFKNLTPKDVQKRLMDHVIATEYLMVKKAKENPAYLESLMALPGFPLLYKPAELVPPPVAPAAPAAPAPAPAGPYAPVPELPIPVPGEPIAPVEPSIDAQMGGVPPVPPSGAV